MFQQLRNQFVAHYFRSILLKLDVFAYGINSVDIEIVFSESKMSQSVINESVCFKNLKNGAFSPQIANMV